MREIKEAIKDGLNIIGLVMLSLISITLLFGCKTTKSIDSTQVEWSSKDSTAEVTYGRHDTSWYQHLLSDSSWWSNIGHIIIYDTTAPKDSAGKYPIQAEMDYKQEHHNAIEQRTDCLHIVYDTARVQVVVKDSTFEKAVYKEITKVRTPWYLKAWLITSLFFLALALGAFAAIKLRQNGK